jgi:type IV pilus assembly protein PilQ
MTTKINMCFSFLARKIACRSLYVLLVFASYSVFAKDTLLLEFDVKQLGPGKLELKMLFDAPPPIPTAFVLKSPNRILVDLWGVENGLSQKQYQTSQGALRSVDFAQSKGRLRLVANLNQSLNFSSFTQNNELFLILDEAGEGSPDSSSQESNSQSTQRKSTSQVMPKISDNEISQRTRVQGIDFERAENGIGRVKIKLSDDRAGLQVLEEGHNVLINLTGALLSDQLNKRLNVQDFDTPVMFIDTFSQGQNAGILIKPSAKPYKFKYYQVGRELLVDFWPKKNWKKSASTTNTRNLSVVKKAFTGEKIDLNFQNVNIRSVLQIIAEVAQKNLVVDDSVSGTITLRLKNVPWDQALDIVLKTRGLDKRSVGNVLLVAPAAKLAERERIELEGQKQVEELAPIETEFIQINYRKSSELKSRIEEASLISKRGFVLADDATNVLMIRETAKQLNVIKNTLTKFDVSVSQIMVEAKLIAATSDVTKELGVRWGAGYSDGSFSVSGTGADNGLAGTPLAVDLGVSGAGQSAIRLGYVSQNGLSLSAELSALNSTGDAEIVSQPKIITTNGKAAEIESGQELPYVVVNDGTPTVEFKDVVLSLKVTPQITPGDQIALELEVKQDSVGQVLSNGEVSINKNLLKTSVVVKDGDTIVLGGIYRNATTNALAKTPVLGDLPLIGGLFRQSKKSVQKNELLIFITPKLLRESLKTN